MLLKKHRLQNASAKNAERKFMHKHKSLQSKNPLKKFCEYIIFVLIIFLIIYTFMVIISSTNHPTTHKSKPPSHTKSDSSMLQNEPKHPQNDYLIFKNFMAPQVGGKSKGLFEKFESRHDHKLVQLYCDSLRDECIGYAFNQNGGYQFYSSAAWPMEAKKGWNFYMKHDPKNKNINLDGKGLKMSDLDEQMLKKYTKNTEKITPTQLQPIKKKKYISYAQNVGRVNNQLVSFEAMIQYALHYERTLVIPWPRHQNHVMGLELNFWDFEKLKEIVDIIVEDELPKHLKKYRTETEEECTFIKLIGKGIDKESNQKCEMIYLYEGDLGIFHFRDGPKDVMKYMIPAKYIRDSVETFLKNEFGQLRYRVGVHRRAMKEGGKDPKTGDVHVCRWESRGIHGDSRFEWLRKMIKKVANGSLMIYERIIAMYHHSCAMDFYDLQNILLFHKQPLIKDKEKFFIAHDHQEQNVIDSMKVFGGIEQPSKNEWSRSKEAYKIHKEKCKEYGHCSNEKTLRMKEEILWDMWALYYADFLAGTWMSTLTRTICHWKGEEKSMYSGNQCFLKWKWEKTVDGQNNDWFELKGLNETALFD